MTVADGVEIAAGAESAVRQRLHRLVVGRCRHDHDNLTPEEAEQLDTAMTTSFQPFVDQLTSGELNTEGLGGQDLEFTIAADGAKVFDLTAEIVDWEVSPGEIVKAWTYNGTVPGPTMRGEVGDRIRINLTNELPLATDLHMHGMILPNDQDGVSPITQDAIEPGETYTYEYLVTDPAIAMYHPHIHGMQTIPDGMWGAMIFSPAGRWRHLRVHHPRTAGPISGIDDPGRPGGRPGAQHGAQRRRCDRPVAQRQVVPGHRAVLAEAGRVDAGELLQRGPACTTRCTCTSSRSWWWPGTASRWTSPTGPTPSRSDRASATPCSSRRRRPAPGSGTATSSPTPSVKKACSAWSPRSRSASS